MSYSQHFVINNNLRPGDAIMLKKKFFGMFDHFAVFLGRDKLTNQPVFAANYTSGVSILTDDQVNTFLKTLIPSRIDRFHGSNEQRFAAVKRAFKYKDQKNYNLIFNNCEHYKNFVQFGRKYSRQVDKASDTLLLTGGVAVLTGLTSKNDTTAGWGLFALALGVVTKLAADHE